MVVFRRPRVAWQFQTPDLLSNSDKGVNLAIRIWKCFYLNELNVRIPLVVSIALKREELRPNILVYDLTFSNSGLKAQFLNPYPGWTVRFLGEGCVMIGVFRKRVLRPTSCHQCLLVLVNILSVFTPTAYDIHTRKCLIEQESHESNVSKGTTLKRREAWVDHQVYQEAASRAVQLHIKFESSIYI